MELENEEFREREALSSEVMEREKFVTLLSPLDVLYIGEGRSHSNFPLIITPLNRKPLIRGHVATKGRSFGMPDAS